MRYGYARVRPSGVGAQPHWNWGRSVGLCRAARAEGDRAGPDRANRNARPGRDGRRGFVNARRRYVIGDLLSKCASLP